MNRGKLTPSGFFFKYGVPGGILLFLLYAFVLSPDMQMHWASDADRLIEMANRQRWSLENRQRAAGAAFDVLKKGGLGTDYDAQLAALRDGYIGDHRIIRRLRAFVKKYAEEARTAAIEGLMDEALAIAFQHEAPPVRPWNKPEPVHFVINAWRDGDNFATQPRDLRPQATYPSLYMGISEMDDRTPSEIAAIVASPGTVGLVVHTPVPEFDVGASIGGGPAAVSCGTAYRHVAEMFIVDLDAGQLIARWPKVNGGPPPLRSSSCRYIGSAPKNVRDFFDTVL